MTRSYDEQISRQSNEIGNLSSGQGPVGRVFRETYLSPNVTVNPLRVPAFSSSLYERY